MILFVVPAYNEDRNISDFIAETHRFASAQKWDHRILVVDDGSTDRTAELVREAAERLPCQLISYQPNRGVGEAFRRGLNEALRQAADGDRIVTLEADRTGDLGILPEMIRLSGADHDVVLASCYAAGGRIEGTNWYRMFLSKSANLLIRWSLRLRNIHTFSSFYRVYRPSALRAVLQKYGDFYLETGFACVIDLLGRLARTGQRITEVPMVLQGSKRRGPSKMKVWRTVLGYLRVIVRNAAL